MKSDDRVPCPHCGEEIGRKDKSCPFCGSDEMTGWSEKKYLDGIELPEEDDYEEIRRNEFENGMKKLNRTWILVTAVIVLAVFLAGVLSVLR